MGNRVTGGYGAQTSAFAAEGAPGALSGHGRSTPHGLRSGLGKAQGGANVVRFRPAGRFSPFKSLDEAIVAEQGAVPLAWISSHEDARVANFGDALSPLVVAALSGLPPAKSHFDSPAVRMSAAGTIVQV